MNVQVNGEQDVEGIYDSGSNATLVNYHVIKRLKQDLMKCKGVFKTLSGISFTQNRAKLTLKVNEIEEEMDVFVVRNSQFSYDILLGLDAIKKFKLVQNENLDVYQKVGEGRFEKISKICEKTVRNKERESNLNDYVQVSELGTNLSYLAPENRKKVIALMRTYESVFARDKFDVGLIEKHEAEIRLTEYRYVSKKPYRCSIPDQKEIDTQIGKLLAAGLIEESSSPFGAPVTLAFKKEDDRKTRLCIDFRELNKLVVPEAQPFPRIEDIMVKAGNCKWFSTFDINSAFWSIPIRRQDRAKTGFVTQSGHYQWVRLPFGLKISPAVFQRILSNIIRRHGLTDFCTNYIDDILVFSSTFEEHLQQIGKLMEAIRGEGFKLKLSKCHLAKNSIKYLGHIIENNGVRPAKDNLRAIQEFERPKNKRNVRQLLGKVNFYYKYIEKANEKLEPLHNLLRKSVIFKWSDECEKAFRGIKAYLCSSPILAIYDPERPVFVCTDASGVGLGAILKQPQDDGLLHPVAYFSRRLKPTEQKRKAIYLECLAIKEAIVYWQHWLIGREFTVVTDHKPLESMRVKARTDEVLGELMHYLSQYQFKIVYAKGSDNLEADSLSRNPVLEHFDNEEDVLRVVNLIRLEDIVDDQERNKEEIQKSKKIIVKGNISYKNLKNRHRIFISEELGKRLIRKIHDQYGHIGAHHISRKLRPNYYFRTMDKLVEGFCKSCDTCIRNKTRTGRRYGKLSKLGPARRPFEIMSVDTIGGFAGNRSPKRYMHLLVDHFSRRAFISATRGQTAKDFIQLLEKATGNHEVKILLADQYPAINSTELKQYLKKRNIRLVLTAINNPEANGLNERLNQTLVNRIRCKINERNHRAWPKIALECVDEYNRTDHSVTKFAPDYLMFGKVSNIVPTELSEKRDLEKDRSEALLNSSKDFWRNKKRIDKYRRKEPLRVGDYVYVENGNKLNRNKLEEVRSGPFEIIARVSNSMYEIDCDKRKKEARVFHITKLRRAFVPLGGEM